MRRAFYILTIECLGLFSPFLPIKAQTIWSQTYISAPYCSAERLYTTKSGGYIFTGTGAPSQDFWMLATDSLGNILWQQFYGGSNSEFHYSSNSCPFTGGYVLTGSTWSYFNGTSMFSDTYVVKTDEAGNVEFERNFGDSEVEIGTDIVQLRDSGYAVGVYYRGNDYGMMGLDKNGDSLWFNKIGGAAWGRPFAVAQFPSGEIISCGVLEDSDSVSIEKFFISCYSLEGDTLWTKRLADRSPYDPDDPQNRAFDVVINSQGNALVTGTIQVLINSQGDILSLNDSTNIPSYTLRPTPDKGFIGSSYGRIVKYDALGTMEWIEYHHEHLYNIHDCIPTRDGGYLVAGVDFSGSGSRAKLIKLNCRGRFEPDSTCVPETPQPPPLPQAFSIYPSPATTDLYLDIPESETTYCLALIDAAGRSILQVCDLHQGRNAIQLPAMAGALYHCRVTSSDHDKIVLDKKIVVMGH